MVEYDHYLKVESETIPEINILKVDKNNCITITRIKDSWTREEVRALIFRAYNLRTEDKYVRSTESMNKWIDDNI